MSKHIEEETTGLVTIDRKGHIGRDGIERVRVTYSLTARQIIYNRTGIQPACTAWVPTAQFADEIARRIYGQTE